MHLIALLRDVSVNMWMMDARNGRERTKCAGDIEELRRACRKIKRNGKDGKREGEQS